MHQIRFRLGAPHGKRSFGLQARRWYGQQIGLPMCLFTSSEDGHFRLNHLQSALCCALSVFSCNCGRQCSAAAASMSHSYQISSSESLVATGDRGGLDDNRSSCKLQHCVVRTQLRECVVLHDAVN